MKPWGYYPWKWRFWTPKNGGGWFRWCSFSIWLISRFQPLVFRGVYVEGDGWHRWKISTPDIAEADIAPACPKDGWRNLGGKIKPKIYTNLQSFSHSLAAILSFFSLRDLNEPSGFAIAKTRVSSFLTTMKQTPYKTNILVLSILEEKKHKSWTKFLLQFQKHISYSL